MDKKAWNFDPGNTVRNNTLCKYGDFKSCGDIKAKNPNARNGFYYIKLSDESKRKPVYCDMRHRGHAWTRIASCGNAFHEEVDSIQLPVRPVTVP